MKRRDWTRRGRNRAEIAKFPADEFICCSLTNTVLGWPYYSDAVFGSLVVHIKPSNCSWC